MFKVILNCIRSIGIVKFVSAVTLLLLVIPALNACVAPHYAGQRASPFPCKSYQCNSQVRSRKNKFGRY